MTHQCEKFNYSYYTDKNCINTLLLNIGIINNFPYSYWIIKCEECSKIFDLIFEDAKLTRYNLNVGIIL